MTTKIVKAYYDDGDEIEGVYTVLLDGDAIGEVRRDDSVSKTYWGRWNAGRMGFETRKEAVDYLIKRKMER